MTSHDQIGISRLAYERAKRVMPGGDTCSSVCVAAFPLYLKSRKGAYVTDVDGNSYLDFQNNFTALIHGYDHAEVNSALMAQIGRGLGLGALSTPMAEAEIASLAVRFGRALAKLADTAPSAAVA